MFFDTGAAGNEFFISDSFKNFFVNDSAFVQVGKFKKQMRINYMRSNQRNFFDVDALGKNSIMVGWKFFENKIIEFDFQNQHILVYDELPDITEYSKIKITVPQSQYPKLLIPAQVVIQGKTIDATFFIDTGCNSFVVLSTDHIKGQGIDTTNASYGKSGVSGGVIFGFSIPGDTIKIGDLYTANQDMPILFNNFPNVSGLLGTKALENFSVILDLLNFDLYLKKNEN
ncbi:MAG: aspartyl protease family protein [Candidatus Azobacteroides sp.]|nr:aspartyl protease family protein [Candidatus Azobacteroides sp.]